MALKDAKKPLKEEQVETKEPEVKPEQQPKQQAKPSKKTYKKYKLGKACKNSYFTEREAECMYWMLKGRTIARIAEELKISPRTVEFYIKHMKTKLGCKSKFALVDLMHEIDFFRKFDFLVKQKEK